jgi:callose synthase
LYGVKAVKIPYLLHDVVCAHIIFVPLFILGGLQLPGMIQTWLLYHNALSTDVVVSDILRYARKTQELGSGGAANEDLIEQIADLKKIVQKQEQAMTSAGLLSGGPNGTGMQGGPSSGSVADLLSRPAPVAEPERSQSDRSYGRTVSMSGIDVWGNMALGDTQISTNIYSNEAAPSGNGSATESFSFTQPMAMPPR